nr:hypothetical protein [Pseudonocardia sp. AL041005-10]
MTAGTDPDPDLAAAAVEHCFEQGWTDGLPVVPASRALVDRFLATTGLAPETEIGRLPQLDRAVTVELAAINAVMAGCRPEYFPVVLAAWAALTAERATGGGGWQSTSGPAPLIVVNGPVRDALGFNATGGVFGPGFRPNATVARSIGLIVRNVYGVHPHALEQATQGLPGRWQICIAENEEESPWEPLSVEAGVAPGESAVSATLLRTCEYVDNRHTGSAEQLLADVADTLSRTGAWIFRHASAGVVFCPSTPSSSPPPGSAVPRCGPGWRSGAAAASPTSPGPGRTVWTARSGSPTAPAATASTRCSPAPAGRTCCWPSPGHATPASRWWCGCSPTGPAPRSRWRG